MNKRLVACPLGQPANLPLPLRTPTRNPFRAICATHPLGRRAMSKRLLALTCLIVLFLSALFLGWRNAPVREAKLSSEEEEQQAYQWFDTLGFPDLAPCPFIKVATGRTSQRRE